MPIHEEGDYENPSVLEYNLLGYSGRKIIGKFSIMPINILFQDRFHELAPQPVDLMKVTKENE